MNEVLTHEFSGQAILMLDWFTIDQTNFTKTSKITRIRYVVVLDAIPKINDKQFNEKEKYILNCFDWLFYYIDRTEQQIFDGFFRFDNVIFIYYPYYKKIYEHKSLYEGS